MESSVMIELTERALIARINRRLAKDGISLRRNRNYGRGNLGELFFLDLETGNIVERKPYWLSMRKHLEDFARELGVMSKFERLEGSKSAALPEKPRPGESIADMITRKLDDASV